MYFTQGLQRALQQRPNTVASICNGRTRTYRELGDRVARLASGIAKLAEPREEQHRIAILALNSDHYLEAYLAIAWMGAVAVPVNFRWSQAEVAYSLNDCEASFLLVDDSFAEMAVAISRDCPALKTVLHLGREDDVLPGCESLITASDPMPDTRTGYDALLGIFYTGGTTGRSKGVLLSHRNVICTGLAALGTGAFSDGAIGLHAAPMFHLADMVMLTCLVLRGGTHVMLPAFEPGTMLDMMAQYRVTDTLVVPAMLGALLRNEAIDNCDLTALRYILYGASPAPEALIELAMAKLSQVNLMQGYGMTETAGLIAFLLPEAHRDPNHPERLRSAGRAVVDVELLLVDQDGNDLPLGEIGEVIVRGPNITRGYLNLPETTASTIKDGWLHTGDLAHMDDEGYVFLVDRAKDMIITGGENVYSAEVENAVSKHPSVLSAAAIGIPDPDMGEKVHVTLVLKPEAALDLDGLQAFCRDHLAGYKLPRSMECVEALPISAAGKVLKTELRKPFWAGHERAV